MTITRAGHALAISRNFKLMQKMKSDRVQGFLWANFAVGTVLSVIAQVHSIDTARAIPVVVRRRPSLDIYTVLQGNNTITGSNNCDFDSATYLVEENQCIKNQHLFNGNKKCMTILQYIDWQ